MHWASNIWHKNSSSIQEKLVSISKWIGFETIVDCFDTSEIYDFWHPTNLGRYESLTPPYDKTFLKFDLLDFFFSWSSSKEVD